MGHFTSCHDWDNSSNVNSTLLAIVTSTYLQISVTAGTVSRVVNSRDSNSTITRGILRDRAIATLALSPVLFLDSHRCWLIMGIQKERRGYGSSVMVTILTVAKYFF